MLRATTACTFLTSQLPKVVRTWCVLYILTCTCASRHNGVQFFISHLASWLRTRRFSEPTFRPSGASNHWTRRRMARERRGAGSSLVSMETPYYAQDNIAHNDNVLHRKHFYTQKLLHTDAFTHKSFYILHTDLLSNVLRATTACNFFYISHLATQKLLHTEAPHPPLLARLYTTFYTNDPPEPQIIAETDSVSRLSYLSFAHLHLLSSELAILDSNLL